MKKESSPESSPITVTTPALSRKDRRRIAARIQLPNGSLKVIHLNSQRIYSDTMRHVSYLLQTEATHLNYLGTCMVKIEKFNETKYVDMFQCCTLEKVQVGNEIPNFIKDAIEVPVLSSDEGEQTERKNDTDIWLENNDFNNHFVLPDQKDENLKVYGPILYITKQKLLNDTFEYCTLTNDCWQGLFSGKSVLTKCESPFSIILDMMTPQCLDKEPNSLKTGWVNEPLSPGRLTELHKGSKLFGLKVN